MSDSVSKAKTVIGIARAAIARKLEVVVDEPLIAGLKWLDSEAATFVTLTINGVLRGCIGTLEAHRSLKEDLEANALAAAFSDPRFPPLTTEEFFQSKLEVSILTELEAMHAHTENIAISKLRPGIDGVVFKMGGYRSTFLPQVWDQLPDPVAFLGQLKVKAGLSAEFWHPEVLLFKYQVKKYRELDLPAE